MPQGTTLKAEDSMFYLQRAVSRKMTVGGDHGMILRDEAVGPPLSRVKFQMPFASHRCRG